MIGSLTRFIVVVFACCLMTIAGAMTIGAMLIHTDILTYYSERGYITHIYMQDLQRSAEIRMPFAHASDGGFTWSKLTASIQVQSCVRGAGIVTRNYNSKTASGNVPIVAKSMIETSMRQ